MEDKIISPAEYIVDLNNIKAMLMIVLRNQSIIQAKLTGEDQKALKASNDAEVSRLSLKLLESLTNVE